MCAVSIQPSEQPYCGKDGAESIVRHAFLAVNGYLFTYPPALYKMNNGPFTNME